MKRTLNHYSQSFKQQVLDDYFQSGMSQVECYTKWKIPQRTLNPMVQTEVAFAWSKQQVKRCTLETEDGTGKNSCYC